MEPSQNRQSSGIEGMRGSGTQDEPFVFVDDETNNEDAMLERLETEKGDADENHAPF